MCGTCAGLLVFGALSDRFSTQRLFVGSLVATCASSLACAAASSIEALIALRTLQGAAAAAPAVFAPAILKALFDKARAVRAMGLLGSIESLAPALAPIAGAGLLLFGDWRASFFVLAAAAGALALLTTLAGQIPQVGRRARSGYVVLLSNVTFLRYALSQAFVLGGLLTSSLACRSCWFGRSAEHLVTSSLCRWVQSCSSSPQPTCQRAS
ncbi:MFS transporter [Sphingomonas mucosissima]|uniref:MFS transporter n=1 Tax=Sphingomonas mucosissima TaxID=370959 RepID=UPI003CCB940F